MRRRGGVSADALLAGAAGLAVLALVVKDAWVCDDAYITFRTVDHFWQGFGLEWNVGERVQGSTHPLWLLALIALQPLVGEPYWAAVGLGLVATAALLAVVAGRVAPNGAAAALGFVALGASKAFVDFSTSGLESPLSHLLVAVCAAAGLAAMDGLLGVAAGLLLLCRLDLALLVIPLLVLRMAKTGGRAWWDLLPAAGIPAAWMTFSLVYFGEPLPNTALAKLAQQIPLADRVDQGLAYLANSLAWDPVTLPTLGFGVFAGLVVARKEPVATALALGAALGLGYAVLVGGDFMSGRFLAAPLVAAVCALVAATGEGLEWGIGAAVLGGLTLGVSASNTRSPLRTGLDYTDVSWDPTGIADERGFYFQAQGVLPMLRQGRRPEKPGRPDTHDWGDTVLVDRTVGINGYTAGPHVHLIDRYALTDALLARLPVRYEAGWRPGHWDRPIPAGYRATLRTGRFQVEDPDIGACFQRVQAVHTGPLFTVERWKAVWTLNTVGCDDLWRGRWMHPQTTDWQTG